VEATKSNRKTSRTFSSSATKGNENTPTEDNLSIEVNHSDQAAFSEKKDPLPELASKQDFQN